MTDQAPAPQRAFGGGGGLIGHVFLRKSMISATLLVRVHLRQLIHIHPLSVFEDLDFSNRMNLPQR